MGNGNSGPVKDGGTSGDKPKTNGEYGVDKKDLQCNIDSSHAAGKAKDVISKLADKESNSILDKNKNIINAEIEKAREKLYPTDSSKQAARDSYINESIWHAIESIPELVALISKTAIEGTIGFGISLGATVVASAIYTHKVFDSIGSLREANEREAFVDSSRDTLLHISNILRVGKSDNLKTGKMFTKEEIANHLWKEYNKQNPTDLAFKRIQIAKGDKLENLYKDASYKVLDSVNKILELGKTTEERISLLKLYVNSNISMINNINSIKGIK
jgi:hypothetical protein